MRKTSRLALACSLVLAAACETGKSNSPLTPTVAGAQNGVSITAPKPVAPSTDARFTVGASPIVLVVENSTSTSERPITYAFEVATDGAFGEIVSSKAGVQPGSNGRTEWQVAAALSAGRTYHWRARAGDGANVSPYSDVARFQVSEPVVLQPPVPFAPKGNEFTSSLQPVLRTLNVDRSGPAGDLMYDFELATSTGFQSLVLARETPEGHGGTEITVDQPLENGRTYYWRVRAREATVTGPWSAIAEFRTTTPFSSPAPPPSGPGPAPLPPPAGTGIPNAAEGEAMVAFIKDDLIRRGISISGDCGAFEITKRVAWAFRHRGAGLERKTTGRNCDGFSQDIVLFPGISVDMLIGGGGDNGPAWQVHDWPGWAADWVAPFNPDGGGF